MKQLPNIHPGEVLEIRAECVVATTDAEARSPGTPISSSTTPVPR